MRSTFRHSLLTMLALVASSSTNAFVALPNPPFSAIRTVLSSSTSQVDTVDYTVPEDAVVVIKPAAMKRLQELKAQQKADELVVRMGVKSGGCSGMSYVMDFEDTIEDDDQVDVYGDDGDIKCVVDAKSMLYLFGLELDYSDELIGGGFKFNNPNAEESCGCGSSFNV